MLDTAGRLHIDEALMHEVAAVRDATKPTETLLVADAMTGQDAVNVAKSFDERIGITGIVLTRIDGDARGGAALSMRAVTGKPIKLLGIGEKLDALEAFHPERIAGRILGMGDVVSLVEKAAETIDQRRSRKARDEAGERQLRPRRSRVQLQQLRKMGGMGGIMGMLPGIGKIKKQLEEAKIDDKILKRQEAIIGSMTKKERQQPEAAQRLAPAAHRAGSGTTVPRSIGC